VNNWNAALFKAFPLRREGLRLELRWETYNTFNHTQFSSLDTTARFDPTGKQVNSDLGAFTAARDPRYMQVAAKLLF
jgi:hypothetical protein